MIKKYEFIEKTLFIIRKELEENLPDWVTLEEMIDKRNKILKNLIKEK